MNLSDKWKGRFQDALESHTQVVMTKLGENTVLLIEFPKKEDAESVKRILGFMKKGKL